MENQLLKFHHTFEGKTEINRMISVLGLDSGYTVEYNPLPPDYNTTNRALRRHKLNIDPFHHFSFEICPNLVSIFVEC